MGKYFNNDEFFGRHSNKTLRIVDVGGGDEPEGNGWQICRGGMINQKGKLVQEVVIAHCRTKAEAEKLLESLCFLN